MLNYKIIIAFSAALLLNATLPSPAAASPDGVGPAEPGAAETWGAGTQVVPAGRFFISGQPDALALERAKAEGVTVVISLRGESESDWDEAGAAASLGLDFYRVPLNGKVPELAAGPLIQISEIVQANPDARILVHCSSGTRASAWYAVYLADYLGMGIDEAIAVANETGLKSKSMEDKVRAYLAQ